MNKVEARINSELEYHAPGEPTVHGNEGDVILVAGHAFISKAISAVQRLEHPARYADFTHAAYVLGGNGIIAESLEWGVELEDLRKYDDTAYVVIHQNPDRHDVLQMGEFVGSVLASPEREGYGYLTILSILLTNLTGSKLTFGLATTQICSGFVASALVRMGHIFDKEPHFITPADLAAHFDARRA